MADGGTHRYDTKFFVSPVRNNRMTTQVFPVYPVGMMFTEVFSSRKVRFVLIVHSDIPFTIGLKELES